MKLFDLVAGPKIPRYSMFKSLISRHVLAKEIAVSRSGRLLRTWTHTHPHTRIVHRHSCSIKMRCDLKNAEGEGGCGGEWEVVFLTFLVRLLLFHFDIAFYSVLHLPEEFVRFNSERQTIRIPTMEQEWGERAKKLAKIPDFVPAYERVFHCFTLIRMRKMYDSIIVWATFLPHQNRSSSFSCECLRLKDVLSP